MQDDFDGLIFPGGFGVAKNLSTVAFHGADARVNEEVVRAVKETNAAGKAIGALMYCPRHDSEDLRRCHSNHRTGSGYH